MTHNVDARSVWFVVIVCAAAFSGLLKLWLRDLREPLCTTGMFGSFIGAVSDDAEVHEKSVEVCGSFSSFVLRSSFLVAQC